MPITAKLKHLRIAPRKVRLVADLIRGKSVEEARSILGFTVKRAALPLLKLLNSGVANAKNNFQADEPLLYISKITVDEGPKLKRWRARARGRAAQIQKKSSHVFLALDLRKGKLSKRITEKPIVKRPKEEKAEPKLKEKTRPEKKQKVQSFKSKAFLREPKKPKFSERIRKVFRRKAF